MKNSDTLKSQAKRAVVITLVLLVMNCTSYYRQKYDFYYRINDWESAEYTLSSGLITDPDNPELHFLLGQVYGHQDNFDKMDSAFKRSFSISKRYSFEIDQFRNFFDLQQLKRGIEAYNSSNFALVIEELSWIESIQQNETRHYKYLGLAYSKLGQYEEARNNLELSIEYTDDFESKLELARVYHMTGQPQKLIDITGEVLQSFPLETDILLLRAMAYEDLVRYQDAAATYDDILQIDPENSTARYNLAFLLSRTGRMDEAIPHLQQLYAEDPDNDQLEYTICSLLYDTEQYEECLNCFVEYSIDHPGGREALEYLFVLNRKLQNWEDAKEIRQQLNGFDPTDQVDTE